MKTVCLPPGSFATIALESVAEGTGVGFEVEDITEDEG